MAAAAGESEAGKRSSSQIGQGLPDPELPASSPEGYTTIFGYGSLMSHSSARKTMPSAK